MPNYQKIQISYPFNTYRWVTDKDFLEREYIQKGKSAKQIAREQGCSHSTVLQYLTSHGFNTNSVLKPHRRSGQVPFGYRLKGGTLVLNYAEKAALAKMLSLRSEGYSLREIASKLDLLGIPTKNRKGKWKATSIMKILQCRQIR